MDSITTASAEIASGNQDLSARTEATAAACPDRAEHGAPHFHLAPVADAARQPTRLAGTAAEVAARAVRCERGGDHMGDINQSSRKIADIIGVIDSIAFRPHPGANAAVEPPVQANRAAVSP